MGCCELALNWTEFSGHTLESVLALKVFSLQFWYLLLGGSALLLTTDQAGYVSSDEWRQTSS